MNTKTLIISMVIGFFAVCVIVGAVSGALLPTNSNAKYIRQSAAERQVQGGGTNFGK